MTHSYNISGMTCSACVAKVRSELLKLGHVLSADVQLQAPQATITMDRHIPLDVLQQAAGKYIITEADTAMQQDAAGKEEPGSYYPIFLIFAFIAGAATLVQVSSHDFSYRNWMMHFMAGFFLVFSMFKLLNVRAFADGYSSYDIIARRFRIYGFIYPFIELLLGIAYLTGFQPVLTNAVTLVVMTVSSVGVIQSLLKRSQFQCACLGTIIRLPLSKVTLFEDLLMVLMTIIMLFI